MIYEPKNLTNKQKKKIIECHKYKKAGGKVVCGHDFWDNADNAQPGDILLCTRCGQYFVKANDLPWWIEGGVDAIFSHARDTHSNHISDRKGEWYYPIDIRVQDCNGTTI